VVPTVRSDLWEGISPQQRAACFAINAFACISVCKFGR
jgi:hypothetical protein